MIADDVRPWRRSDGDTRCQSCGYTYRPWFTDNSLWNEVMGGSAYAGDPGGYLCARCFTSKAEDTFPGLIWRVIPQWNGRAEAMDWPIADAALANPPALDQHDAEVGARALREAADDLDREPWRRENPQGWLRARADALTSEGGQP